MLNKPEYVIEWIASKCEFNTSWKIQRILKIEGRFQFCEIRRNHKPLSIALEFSNINNK